jgi:hypothetical protein
MLPAACALRVWRSPLVTALLLLILVLVWLVLVAGVIWFVRLIKQHPTMEADSRRYRIMLLILGAVPLGAFPSLYLITAPFVFHTLARDPNASPQKVLNLGHPQA